MGRGVGVCVEGARTERPSAERLSVYGPRTDRTHASRFRVHVWGMATVLASMLWAAMADSTPEDALRAVEPALADARADVATREQALGVLHGFDASVTFRPGVSFGTYEADAVPPEWSSRLYVDATLGYSYDEPALLAELDGLERARAAVARLRRRAVARALTAHARLLQVQLTVVQLEGQVTSQGQELAALGAQANAASVPAGSTSADSISKGSITTGSTSTAGRSGGAASRLAGRARRDLELRRLGVEGLRLQVEQSRLELGGLQAELAGYGMSAPAAYASLRFVLPPARARSTSAYRLRQLAVRRAEAELTQAGVYGTFQDLAFSGSYTTGNVAVRTDVGIVEATPRAELSLAFPGGPDAWSVGVHATVALSAAVLSTTLGSLPDLQRRVRRAHEALTAYERDFPKQAARRRAAAQLAERALGLAERQRSLADTRDARRTLYSAWAEYVRQVRGYLEYVDAGWEARER